MADHIRSQYVSMEEQDRQRRTMIANVSHDLRTPLASIHGYVERLHNRYETLTDIERKGYLAVALKNSLRLGRLIDDLFELSKLEAKEIQPCFEPFSISELAQDVLQKFRLQAETRNITLHFEPANPMPQVHGDIALLERALSNLIDNAIEHSNTGDCVSLKLHPSGDTIRVQVEDNGEGIPEKHKDAIFRAFLQSGKYGQGFTINMLGSDWQLLDVSWNYTTKSLRFRAVRKRGQPSSSPCQYGKGEVGSHILKICSLRRLARVVPIFITCLDPSESAVIPAFPDTSHTYVSLQRLFRMYLRSSLWPRNDYPSRASVANTKTR